MRQTSSIPIKVNKFIQEKDWFDLDNKQFIVLENGESLDDYPNKELRPFVIYMAPINCFITHPSNLKKLINLSEQQDG